MALLVLGRPARGVMRAPRSARARGRRRKISSTRLRPAPQQGSSGEGIVRPIGLCDHPTRRCARPPEHTRAHVLVGREMVDGELTLIRWLPLGGLRRLLLRPDRVKAALQGDHPCDDVRPALRAAASSLRPR